MAVTLGIRRPGRPREPVPQDVADELFEWLCTGKPLSLFCAQPGRPARRTVLGWRAKDPDFRRSFDCARELGFDHLADEVLEIARESLPDGRVMRAWLEQQRLRIQVRFCLMSRWFPKR